MRHFSHPEVKPFNAAFYTDSIPEYDLSRADPPPHLQPQTRSAVSTLTPERPKTGRRSDFFSNCSYQREETKPRRAELLLRYGGSPSGSPS